jgi:hypothetical protein
VLLRCEECRTLSDETARPWRAYVVEGDDLDELIEYVVFYSRNAPSSSSEVPAAISSQPTTSSPDAIPIGRPLQDGDTSHLTCTV